MTASQLSPVSRVSGCRSPGLPRLRQPAYPCPRQVRRACTPERLAQNRPCPLDPDEAHAAAAEWAALISGLLTVDPARRLSAREALALSSLAAPSEHGPALPPTGPSGTPLTPRAPAACSSGRERAAPDPAAAARSPADSDHDRGGLGTPPACAAHSIARHAMGALPSVSRAGILGAGGKGAGRSAGPTAAASRPQYRGRKGGQGGSGGAG